MRAIPSALLALLLIAGPAAAAPLPSAAESAAELTPLLRNLLLANLPDPLIEKSFNWGAMKEVANGVTWRKQGILLKPEIQRKLHNDGLWRRVKVVADAPARTLQLGIADLERLDEGTMTFSLGVILPVHVHFEQQLWESGVRLYSGSTRARCNVGLRLEVESVCRIESNPKSFFPDVVYRLRVASARLTYSDVVVEHTLGVGGDAAKLLGDAFLDAVKQWKPSLERDLLVKANAAIVKAGDTKEIRVSLSKLLQGQKVVGKKK